MRIPSGTTDQYIYFVAVDGTDYATRETGLTTFTVYRSRDGAAAAVMTTPTVNETDATNMPGVYELLLDEDMTIGSGNDSEEMIFHITHAGMAPVTRTVELYRPKITVGETFGVGSGYGFVDVSKINASSTAATNLQASTETMLYGTVTSATTSTVTASGLTGYGDDTFIGRVLVFRTGTCSYQAGQIIDYDSTGGIFTFPGGTFTTGAGASSTFIIV